MGIVCPQTPSLTPRPKPERAPEDPLGGNRKRLYKEVYPALLDEDFEWMNSTRGTLVITGKDRNDLESANANVYRIKTEDEVQKFITGRQLVDTTVLRWFNIFSVPLEQFLFVGCENTDTVSG